MNSIFFISTSSTAFIIILIFGIIFVTNPSTSTRKKFGWVFILVSLCGLLACYQSAEKLKKYEPVGNMEIPSTD